MKRILVTQRVSVDEATKERRDALDQEWAAFLSRCGFLAVPAPNHLPTVKAMLAGGLADGVLLTGGNNLRRYGGDAPERDAVERHLIQQALARRLPLLGVCRGMQVLQDFFGVRLRKVEGHVSSRQAIMVNGRKRVANAYHRFGALDTVPALEVWANSPDGVVKAVKHRSGLLLGIMWHPERIHPFARADVRLFQNWFGASRAGKGKA